MYFTVDTWKAGSTFWRNASPDVHLNTNAISASEEEGLAIMPGWQSFTPLRARINQQSGYTDTACEKQNRLRGFLVLPDLSSGWQKIYYFVAAGFRSRIPDFQRLNCGFPMSATATE